MLPMDTINAEIQSLRPIQLLIIYNKVGINNIKTFTIDIGRNYVQNEEKRSTYLP